MQFSCYIEINVLCLILLGIFLFRLHGRRLMLSAADKSMVRLLIAACLLCVSDILAIVVRGQIFPGARPLIEGANILYLGLMPVISMLWCDYTASKLSREIPDRFRLLYRLPLLLFTAALLLNPLHHFFFTINAENLYVRGPGVFLHWIVSWFYFIWSGAAAWLAVRSTANWVRRAEYRPYLTFLILPAIGCITQMLLYGVTAVQAGITLSLVLVTIQTQDNQSSADELTGINNRKALKRYVDTQISREAMVSMTVMMLDINHFKHINDTYGHAVGDLALRDAAAILMEVCGRFNEKLFPCRYGGDEFVILGTDISRQTADEVMGLVRTTIAANAQAGDRPYTLEFSIGRAGGLCRSQEDFEHYLRLADENMYEDKQHLVIAR